MGLRQDEPQSPEKRWKKESRSRLETPLTVVVVVAQGKAKLFG